MPPYNMRLIEHLPPPLISSGNKDTTDDAGNSLSLSLYQVGELGKRPVPSPPRSACLLVCLFALSRGMYARMFKTTSHRTTAVDSYAS